MPEERIEIENVNHPGRVTRVDRAKYEAMRAALMAVLPEAAPGLTLDEAREAAKPHLPEALFPGGAKSGWWLMAVQLDLSAKGRIVREATKPMRLHRA